MAEAFLLNHPDLRPFLLSNARPTGRTIGSGSYGSVEEVAIPGAVCAAKKIHDFFQDPTKMPREGIERASREFVRECQLMSTLRHPHIVQFLGVCFLPRTRMPALVMECLLTSLHDILDPEPPSPTKAFIPLSMKRSILYDIASGLAFLHSHTPPIIHRDLSAKNILLNSGMVAKIADLGMARLVPALRAATMTKAPGASIYMPPEALEDDSRYDVTIDIFSIGVIAVFLLSETFPKPLAAAYMNPKRQMVGLTELERRSSYMLSIMKQLGKAHPLIQMIQHCLSNFPEERPQVTGVLEFLEPARAEIDDNEFDVNKLALVQALDQKTQLVQSKDEHIEMLKQQNGIQKEQIRYFYNENSSLEAILKKKQHNDLQKGQIDTNEALVKTLQEQNESLQAEISTLKKTQKIVLPATVTPLKSEEGAVTPVKSLQWPLSLHWRRGNDYIPLYRLFKGSSIVIDGVIYCGGIETSSGVIQYNSECGEWSELPRPPVSGFAMTSFKNQLVLAGGVGNDKRITVWDSGQSKWIHPYPSMPTGRALPAVVGYQNYLVVACGLDYVDVVEVLDSSSGRWYSAWPVPVGGSIMSSVVVGDCWYLSSFGGWNDKKEHILWAYLPTLTSSAISPYTSSAASIWHELPTPPVAKPTLLALQEHLLLIGGREYKQEIHRYDPETKKWRECGGLPVGIYAPCCAVLPSGDLMIAGGRTGDTMSRSKRMWIGNIWI